MTIRHFCLLLCFDDVIDSGDFLPSASSNDCRTFLTKSDIIILIIIIIIIIIIIVIIIIVIIIIIIIIIVVDQDRITAENVKDGETDRKTGSETESERGRGQRKNPSVSSDKGTKRKTAKEIKDKKNSKRDDFLSLPPRGVDRG